MTEVALPAVYGRFSEIWLVDTEYVAPDGERPDPVCLVAEELWSGRVLRLWQDELLEPPYGSGSDVLFVAYNVVAELLVHRALGWADPDQIIDPYAEFLRETNGRETLHGNGLLGALASYSISWLPAADKDVMRDMIVGGGPWSAADREAILDYCGQDVTALRHLFLAMAGTIDLDRALIRGRYMAAVAAMEWAGVPMDVEGLSRVLDRRDGLIAHIIAAVDRDYGVYDGNRFVTARFERYLLEQGIAWPRNDSGGLKLDQETFDERSDMFPRLKPLRDLRRTISGLQENRLQIGQDGRNRTWLNPFGSRTGRNQPSNSRLIFGQPAWWRGFIQATPGYGFAYLDWDQQEFGIAAALSGDPAMQAAYRSGDPYLAFAKQVGAAPPEATKATHEVVRDQYKACVLAVQYGMGSVSLAERTGLSRVEAQSLLDQHHRAYHVFWSWSDAVVNTALWRGWIESELGWRQYLPTLPKIPNERSVRNFPMQANGAEMLRVACILAVEAGIEIVAPVHDAFLIHAPITRLDADVARMRLIMIEASRQILGGFEIGVEAKTFRSPDRFLENRGEKMWTEVAEYVGI